MEGEEMTMGGLDATVMEVAAEATVRTSASETALGVKPPPGVGPSVLLGAS